MTNNERTNHVGKQVGILWRGDRSAEVHPMAQDCRLHRVFEALAERNVSAVPVVYSEEASAEVREQLLQLGGVLVWVNPIDSGRDRADLDALLRDVSHRGIWVSADPGVILKMRTKEVLYRTQEIGWGGDVYLYESLEEFRRQLPIRLMTGRSRVLKQNRGHSGDGVWKVQLAKASTDELPHTRTRLRVRHALRGCVEEEMALGDFVQRCESYFARAGKVIDQSYQERLAEGMIRCYLVHERVVGFGHQATNALFPAPPGAPATAAPLPGPRLYYPPNKPNFQHLKRQLEHHWVPSLCHAQAINPRDLPVIWDADFLLGAKTENDEDTYVLCEINVSSVFPFPEEALAPLADTVSKKLCRPKPEVDHG